MCKRLLYFVSFFVTFFCKHLLLSVIFCNFAAVFKNFIYMIQQEQLFTIEEVAKICGLSRNAAYMHYRRGHLNAVQLQCHRLYFSQRELLSFASRYGLLKAE